MADRDLSGGGGHVPVAVAARNGVDESVHFGTVVVVDGDGTDVFYAGEPDLPIYPRSALKPLQAAAMLSLGLDLPYEQLAIVSASHDGSDRHCDAVLAVLAGAGLGEAALGNVAALPLDVDAARAIVRDGGAPSSLRMNCSGKHAGMLATCVRNGWALDGYLEPEHPLQAAITADIARRTCNVVHVGTDGCGAPAHMVGLRDLTLAFAELAAEGGPVPLAMTAHPDLVGGPTRYVTMLMRSVPGMMAKDGAEGVCVAALPGRGAIGVKIADGSSRPVPAVVVAALEVLGVDRAAFPVDISPPVLGNGRVVGGVRAVVGGRSPGHRGTHAS